MKQLLVILFFLYSMSVSAQDVIVKKDGSTVVCRVVEVTTTEITYKKWSDQNGSNYVMDKSLVSGINYQNGRKETFGMTESLYRPNNQNNGEHNYNDNALLDIDANEHEKIRLKWVAKAGFSLDKFTGTGRTAETAGYDVSFGVAFPFKDNVVLGVNASVFSYNTHYLGNSLETSCYGLSPYRYRRLDRTI